MRTGRPKQRLELSDKDRADLEAVIRSRSLPHKTSISRLLRSRAGS